MVDANGKYEFNPARLGECHAKCRAAVEKAMQQGFATVVQSNTNIKRREMQPYLDLADKYGYAVQEIIVRANLGNTHGVPADKVRLMQSNLEF